MSHNFERAPKKQKYTGKYKNAQEGIAARVKALEPYNWPKGVSGNPKGRPEGTLSAVTRIKQMFTANPDQFDEFLTAYLKDKSNRKHVIEMIDGKPKQSTDIALHVPKPLDDV